MFVQRRFYCKSSPLDACMPLLFWSTKFTGVKERRDRVGIKRLEKRRNGRYFSPTFRSLFRLSIKPLFDRVGGDCNFYFVTVLHYEHARSLSWHVAPSRGVKHSQGPAATYHGGRGWGRETELKINFSGNNARRSEKCRRMFTRAPRRDAESCRKRAKKREGRP